jgi:hypothetical protein
MRLTIIFFVLIAIYLNSPWPTSGSNSDWPGKISVRPVRAAGSNVLLQDQSQPSKPGATPIKTTVAKDTAPPVDKMITDHGVYPAPEKPKLPAAGGTFVDPTFRTTIMRLTDSRDGKDNHNQYSYWPSFNKDSTYLWVTCDNVAYLYSFDPINFRTTNKRRLFQNLPSGVSPFFEDMIWSNVDPNVIFFHDGIRLWSYHIGTTTYTLIKDFKPSLPPSNLWQMSKSDDDDLFAFTRKDDNYAVVGYLAWRRSNNTLYRKDQKTVDEVKTDKTGRYVLVQTGESGKGAIEAQVFDLQNGTIENLTDDEPDYNSSHLDIGKGIVIGQDNWQNRVLRRNLATPHSFTSLFVWPDWNQASHYSLLSENEDWVLISSYGNVESLPAGGFWNEVFLVATDGSKRVRRLAHHHAKMRDYWDTPRASISRDGRFAVFTSNWGSENQRDVFIIRIPK